MYDLNFIILDLTSLYKIENKLLIMNKFSYSFIKQLEENRRIVFVAVGYSLEIVKALFKDLHMYKLDESNFKFLSRTS